MNRFVSSFFLLGVAVLEAQAPHLAGVWKADLQASKFGGQDAPPPKSYLVIIEEKQAMFDRRTKEMASLLSETTGVWGERGEQRSVLTVFLNGKPAIRSYRGVPTRVAATVEGTTNLLVKGETAGRPESFTRRYTLSSEGNKLTVQITSEGGETKRESLLILQRQPETAGAELRKPEPTAGEHFKNVKTEALKGLPESEFIDQMHYFAWSLNRDCEFCHVAHKFNADDKEEKRTARKMIEMAASIDSHNFDGKPEVRCFTCHEGHAHPLSHPQFPDEAAREKAMLEQRQAQRDARR